MSRRILIVDDVATNRIVMKVRLSEAHYEVLQASDGTVALATARRDRPDLILLDMTLPDMDGTELCRRLKAHPETAAIPLIVVTGARSTEAKMRALEAGADEFLSKPLDEMILLARVRNLLRARETAEELALRNGTHRALGFAEAAEGFAPQGRVALISADPRTGRSWRAALAPLLSDALSTITRAEALTPPEDMLTPDVFVIDSRLAPEGAGLRLVSELRANAKTRHSAVLVVVPETARETAAMALDLGANDLVSAPADPQELAIRIRSQLRRKQQADRLRATLEDGLRLALIDPLTGLFNRRYALPHLARIAERAAGTGRGYAVMLLDIDRFKRVNDRHGHAAGDTVLVEVARRLKENLRPVDLVARIGGEEFMVALPETEFELACATAERLRTEIGARPVVLPDGAGEIGVTISIGVAFGSDRAPASEDADLEAEVKRLMEQADRALYGAKASGRNTVEISRTAA
ncbi:diguanylate cyclase [Rhodovulum euryhalinum]|uniref:diguanylate cyclase n=1 Tax=Rhodovulum euryhalinum TaxID=35805 RepID=A0A4R2KUV8_9RHOB|nr:diguanylate cyclase [Rhodovulum euryhalinum]TCO73978.1 response regulator receiver modulated diguanylate cyclase [Rhodovulum euryhalinum]